MSARHSTVPCPVCVSQQTSSCIKIEDVPVYCNVLYTSREQSLAAPTGDIDLLFCKDCGHLFNGSFDARKIDYSLEYENSLHYSSRFQEYAEALARDLVDRYNLHGKKIVEIACGKGDFLASVCQLGDNSGYGFDPSYDKSRHSEQALRNIIIVQDYYSDRYADIAADLVCCRHALEHIEQPRAFLKALHAAITANHGAALYFEVPNALYTLRDLGIWDIIYEHCGYFCEHSLARVFSDSGFAIHRLHDSFGRQFLSIEAALADDQPAAMPAMTVTLDAIADYADAFEKRYAEKVATWENRLAAFQQQGKQVVVWGAGSKGVTFLNALKVTGEVAHIVDLNVHKQGKYVPGTGHQVVSPDHLRQDHPDIVIVMNPIYTDEIARSLASMGIKATLVAE